MLHLQTMVRRNLFNLLLAFLLGGFGMLLAELLLTNHVGGTQNVAIVASSVGAIAIFLGFWAKGVLRHLLVLLLLALSLSGLLGVREHLEEGREGSETYVPAAVTAARPAGYQRIGSGAGVDVERTPQQPDEEHEDDMRDEEYEDSMRGESEDGEAVPPPLAPLSLSGLALMGAVILLAKPDMSENETRA